MMSVHHHASFGRAALRCAWSLLLLLGAGQVWAQPCSVTINAPPGPFCPWATVQVDTTACTGTPPFAFEWSVSPLGAAQIDDPTAVSPIITLSGGVPVSVSVTLTDADGCTDDSNILNIGVSAPNGALAVALNGTTLTAFTEYGPDFPVFTLCDDPLPASADFTFTDASGAGVTPLLIHTGSGFQPPVFPETATFTEGLDTVYYVTQNTQGCVDTARVGILLGVPAAPSVSVNVDGANEFCLPDAQASFSVDLSSAAPLGTMIQVYTNEPDVPQPVASLFAPFDPTYQYTFNAVSCGLTSPPFNNTFTLTMVPTYGCPNGALLGNTAQPIRVSAPVTPFAVASASTICAGDDVNITDQSAGTWIEVTGGTQSDCTQPPITYWEILDGSSPTDWTVSNALGNGDPNGPSAWTPGSGSLNATFNTPGIYTVRITAGGSDLCPSAPYELDICVLPELNVGFTAAADAPCVPATFTTTDTTDYGNACGTVTRSWNVVDNTLFCGGSGDVTWNTAQNVANAEFVINDPGTYTLSYSVTTPCGTQTQDTVITIYGAPSGSFGVVDPAPCVNDVLDLPTTVSGCGDDDFATQVIVNSSNAIINGDGDLEVTGPGPIELILQGSGDCTVGWLGLDTLNLNGQGVPATPTATISPAVICEGSEVLVVVQPQAGVSAYSITVGSQPVVDNDTLLFTATNALNGVSITVTAGPPGCSQSASYTLVVEPLQPSSITVPDDSLCTGDNVILTAVGAGASYTWLDLDDNELANGPTFDFSGTSTTTIVLLDTIGGCISSDTTTIVVNEPPIVTAPSTIILCSDGTPFQLPTPPSGGSYSSGDPAFTLPDLITPTIDTEETIPVTLTVTNANLCSTSVVFDVDIQDLTGAADAGPDLSPCLNDGDITLTGTGTWTDILPYFTGGVFSTALVPAGSYPITICATACANLCDSVVVNVLDTPAVNMPADLDFCVGDAGVQLTAGPLPGDWNGEGPISNTGYWNNPLAGQGTYELNFTMPDADGICTSTGTMQIIVEAPPVADFQVDPVSPCADQEATFTFTGTGGDQWEWNFGDNTTASGTVVSHTFAEPGPYEVTLVVTDLLTTCADSITVQVDVLDNGPELGFTFTPLTGCGDLSVDFTNTSIALAGMSFVWNYGNGQTSEGPEPLQDVPYPASTVQDTTYIISLTVTWPCGSRVLQEVLTVYAEPTLSVLVDNDNGCDTLTTIQVLTTGGVDEFIIDFGDGTDTSWTATDDTAVLQHDYPLAVDDTTYTLQVTVTNGPCAPAVQQVGVTLLRDSLASVISAVPDDGCEDLLVQFAADNVGALSELWNFGDGSAPVQEPTPQHLFTDPGSYWVRHTIFGCFEQRTDSLLVTVHPAPDVQSADVPIAGCTGQPIELAVNASGLANVRWSIPGLGWVNAADYSFTVDEPGTYTLLLAATTADQFACADTSEWTIRVTETQAGGIQLDTLDTCVPVSAITFTALNGAAAFYNWNIEPFGPYGDQVVNLAFDTVGTFRVHLLTTDTNGCVVADSTSLRLYPTPIAQFTSSATSDTPDLLEVDFTDRSIGADNIQWTFHDGSTSADSIVPKDIFKRDGVCDYPVSLRATTLHGCWDEAISDVAGSDRAVPFLPNAFTPDGDGVNETFGVGGSGITSDGFELLIFDRWGELIHSITDPNEQWDGQYDGRIVQDGAYPWRLKARSACSNEMRSYIGHVIVVR